VTQKVQTLFIDDIDGSAAEGTVRLGLDGTEYEIDLNAEHPRQQKDALAAHVRAGRRVSGGSPPARSRRTQGTGKRVERHRGARVGQGAGHQGERPRAGTR
jgi:nucleoid-associated protein Lsr2